MSADRIYTPRKVTVRTVRKFVQFRTADLTKMLGHPNAADRIIISRAVQSELWLLRYDDALARGEEPSAATMRHRIVIEKQLRGHLHALQAATGRREAA